MVIPKQKINIHRLRLGESRHSRSGMIHANNARRSVFSPKNATLACANDSNDRG
jgi:hypothetical protein